MQRAPDHSLIIALFPAYGRSVFWHAGTAHAPILRTMGFMTRKRSQPELVTTVLLLHCHGVDECEVYFEPEGAVHTLRSDDSFRLEAVLPAGQEIEVVYHPQGISVYAEQAWGTRAFNKAGEQLRL